MCAQLSPQDACLPVVVTGLKGRGCSQGKLEKNDNVRSLKCSESKLIYLLAECNLSTSLLSNECESLVCVSSQTEREVRCSFYITGYVCVI